MKVMKRFVCLSLLICGLMLLSEPEVFAGEKGDWRPKYDLFMLWLNFGILAFIIVRFGKKPLMNFLHSQRDELAEEIGNLEKEKERMIAEINKTRQALKDSDAHFAELKEKIIRQGEQRKEEIIRQASEQSEIMMEIAKQKIGNRILVAQREFKEELVDTAFDAALERLPKEMTDADNDKLVRQYLETASAAQV
ncbi:MAG: ATP synthase F0 subunit B [Desulfococcaceae bacterium]|nr:ATP synthase F0 subunit B [Desulfococcaceae bacterium]